MSKEKKAKSQKPRPYAELFRDEEGGFRYRIKGANHEIMCSSESYTTLGHASDGLMDLVLIMGKFGKWYAKDDDSWIHDLTEPAKIVRSGGVVTETVDKLPSEVGNTGYDTPGQPDGFGN
jgi:uncharacterized protein YegP (UPF0339 family)